MGIDFFLSSTGTEKFIGLCAYPLVLDSLRGFASSGDQLVQVSRFELKSKSRMQFLASLLAMPLLLVVRPGVPSSFLLLVAMPEAISSCYLLSFPNLGTSFD